MGRDLEGMPGISSPLKSLPFGANLAPRGTGALIMIILAFLGEHQKWSALKELRLL